MERWTRKKIKNSMQFLMKMLTKLELVIDAYASNMLNVIVDFKY